MENLLPTYCPGLLDVDPFCDKWPVVSVLVYSLQLYHYEIVSTLCRNHHIQFQMFKTVPILLISQVREANTIYIFHSQQYILYNFRKYMYQL